MAQNKEVKPEDLMQHLLAALQLYGQAQTALLDEFASLQDQRTERMKKAGARIADKLGDDHPRVVALRRTRDRAIKMRRGLRDNATRTGKLRELKPYEWMVYGQVVDHQGEPAPDLVVRVFDKDRQFDDVLGYTTTDKLGDFQLVYHERAFHEPGEGAPELYLRVEDAEGNELFSTEEEIRYEAGRIEYYLIELERSREEK
jgi:hypothetical protein